MENEDIEELSIEDHWKDIKDSFIKTGKEVLGPKQKNKEAWISVRSWELIDERKKLKNQAFSNDEPRLFYLFFYFSCLFNENIIIHHIRFVITG